MRPIAALLLLAVAAFAAEKLPVGATKVDDTTWKYTDKAGKRWVYRQTPFGLSKAPEAATEPVRPAAPEARVRVAKVQDDIVSFEKTTAFGTARWTNTRAQLTTEEREALARFERAAAPAQPGTQR